MEKIFEITDMKIRLAKNVSSQFKNNHVAFMKCLVQSQGMSKIMLDGYNSLVYKKMLPRIEDLPKEQKQSIWETAKEMSEGKLDSDNGVTFCKQLWALEYFLNILDGL